MWKYLKITFKVASPSELQIKLTEIGKDGWEIIYYQEKYTNQNIEVDLLAKKPSA